MNITSIVCKNCLPEEYHDRADRLRGMWEIDGEIARCCNCGATRPYYRHKPRPGIKPSQQRAIERIRHYFDESYWRDKSKPLAQFEIRETDYGTLWVSVHTSDHPLIDQGGHFHIGPRGAIEVWSVYDICDNEKKKARHYAKMVRGKVKNVCHINKGKVK